jgi:hypothetical protein
MPLTIDASDDRLEAAVVFVKEIARLKRYAPESTDRYADAMETLNALIADARRLVRE